MGKKLGAYDQTIREVLASIGRIGYDPGQVESWMRLEHSTLDGLSFAQFKREVATACACIDADPKGSVSLAESYGFTVQP